MLADTNAFLAVALDEPEKSWLLQATKGVELAAPAVLPYEVGNALSALVKRKRLGADEAAEAWQVIQSIPVELVEVDIPASLLLAAEHGIYAYDAYFLQCAMRLKCPLLTLDRAMASVARALSIKLVEKP
jgi:predicted nucleic acid-binding protein